MKKSLYYLLSSLFVATLSACDEGDITEVPFHSETDSYVARFTGRVEGLDHWAEGYDIVVAAFDDDSEYAVIQKQVTADAEGNTELVLNGIPTTARTVELCVTNRLRHRIMTYERVQIPTGTSSSDTISLSLSTPVDAGMFATIQRYIFDGPAYNCSLCHGQEGGRAGLDLSKGNSYGNLVGVASTRLSGEIRVKSGDASSSVLHTALAEGNPAGLRYDHSGLADDIVRRLIDDWINGGAQE